MRVITKSKCEDTIRLEDVDIHEHYVVAKTGGDLFLICKETLNYEYRAVCISHNRKDIFYYEKEAGKSIKTLINRLPNFESLHAFNTLHEMLDFVKENTHE